MRCRHPLVQVSDLVLYIVQSDRPQDDVSLLTQLFAKLVNVGVFPSSTYLSPSQPSFFRSALPLIRRRLRKVDGNAEHYTRLWNCIVSSLPSMFTQQTIVGSLFASLTVLELLLGTSAHDRGIISREAHLSRAMFGEASPDVDNWQAITAIILTRTWSQNHARLFVCWMAASQHTQGEISLDVVLSKFDAHYTIVLETFFSSVINVWSSLDHIKYSLLSQHQCEWSAGFLRIHGTLTTTDFRHVCTTTSLDNPVPPFISSSDDSCTFPTFHLSYWSVHQP